MQISVSSVVAASAMTWGLSADRRYLDRTGSITGAPGLFGVGQSVFSVLLTLCAWLKVCSPSSGKERTTFSHQSCSLTLFCPLATRVQENSLHQKVVLRPGKEYLGFIQEPHLQAHGLFSSGRVGFYHSTGHGIVFPNIPLRRMYFSKYCHSLL